MIIRAILIGTAMFAGGAFYVLKDDPSARANFVALYAYYTGDREILFESKTVDEAIAKILARHFGGGDTFGSREAVERKTGPRDFSPRGATEDDGGPSILSAPD